MKSGLILLNKKSGITSFDALWDIKRGLGTGKVGHTGTLDKFARGLLAVLAGDALKLSRWFSGCDKKYKGRIHFGAETDTLDPEGNITIQAELPAREKVEKALLEFTGDILQTPPVYSAIHVNGQRASNLARQGRLPEMKKRQISIYKIELLSWQPPFADIFVHCSSGTYIRSLARDIALAAGSRGHLCELLRTQVAGFKLNPDNDECNISGLSLQPINKNIIDSLGMQWFLVTAQEAEKIYHGKPLELILKDKSPFFSQCNYGSSLEQSSAVFFEDILVAIIEKIDGKWKYGCVFTPCKK
jgi:tRNA pseudouridine55 synthase